MINVIVEDTLGMNKQNVFKVIDVVKRQDFVKFIMRLNSDSLQSDICHAINTIIGNSYCALPCKTGLFINEETIPIPEIVDTVNGHIDMESSAKIQDYLNNKCSVEWIK